MRHLLALSLVLFAAASCAPDPASQRGATIARIDQALERAMLFLSERQEPDGTWRSASYAVLRDEPALTAVMAKTLAYGPPSPARIDALRAARAALVEARDVGLAYPVYTASLAAIALRDATDPAERAALRRWLALLRTHQLDERLGWSPTDAAFGGFGYSPVPPQRPAEGQRSAYDADLSSTLFALGALRACGATPDEPAVVRALAFVERCQNTPGDGGFFFTPTNELQNKAGARPDGGYRSYGAMTADGLRALLRCGLGPDDSRVAAARAWLVLHFDAARQPGEFPALREPERAASYHYWCWSVAHAFTLVGEREFDWATPLAETLLARQEPDGSFKNPFTGVMEDDPLVATPLACAALALAGQALRARP